MKKFLLLIMCICQAIIAFTQTQTFETYFPEGYVKDGSVDYTKYLQTYVSSSDKVILPNFPILVNDNGILVRSNQEIIFQNNSALIMKGSKKSNYSLLILKNVENVKIKNLTIKGDRYYHKDNKGEWGMGVRIENSSNIEIQNRLIEKFWGDGIYITGQSTNNIVISGGLINENRRNGISIISGDKLYISNLIIKNTKGVWPMSAIDIEPNSRDRDKLGLVRFKNIITEKNVRGISVVLNNYLSPLMSEFKIRFDEIKSIDEEIGIKINSFDKLRTNGLENKRLNGLVVFSNFNIINSKTPVLIKGKVKEYDLGPQFHFNAISFENKSKAKNVSDYKSFQQKVNLVPRMSIK